MLPSSRVGVSVWVRFSVWLVSGDAHVYITTNQPDTKTKPNPNSNFNLATKQHALVSIKLNIVTYPTYPEKFIRDMLLHRLHYFRL